MSNYEKLKELAEATKGWDNLKSCWPEETEDGDLEVNWFVGAVTEDDDKYPVLEVNTAQYDALEDAGRLARYYAAANPSAVAALIAENERLQGCEDVLRQLASHVGAGGYNAPEVDPETFARKIMDGINILNDPMAQLVIKKGEQIDQLRAEVAGLRTGYEAYEQVNAELKAEVEGLRKALTSSREFLMRDAKVRRMTDGARHISPMFPLRKLVMEQIDAALGQGEQS
ncbi:hypothetical protein GCM10008969_45010 [Pseudomonas veronii subsp. inensis]|uniref:hypothetical protein n=1 Tax=Pseudomonas veronii TaxID=76761 RepID=UPI0031F92E00